MEEGLVHVKDTSLSYSTEERLLGRLWDDTIMGLARVDGEG